LEVATQTPLNEPTVRLVESESALRGFEVIDQKVHVMCTITLESTFDEDKTVELAALMPMEVELGLLQAPKLYAVQFRRIRTANGYIRDVEGSKLVVPAESQMDFNVTFIGDFAGTVKKQDRFLPEIEITILSD